MKIALLIGVSEYSNSRYNLPGCASDLQTMKQIVEATGEFKEVLSIGENTTSVNVKAIASEWISRFKDETIEEILFYYTGHGEFYRDEFYFQLSDFQRNKRNKTSLTNSELDDWLRSLTPTLSIKIVDACNSGVEYIKSNGSSLDLETYLRKSEGKLGNCIFMFSSRLDQFSYQKRGDLSEFTRSFAKAIQSFTGETIRYRDIMDSIADDFATNSDQQPLFVTQSHFTEVFCTLTSQVRDATRLNNTKISSQSNLSTKTSFIDNLKNAIQQDAKRYVTESVANQAIEYLQEQITSQQCSEVIRELFELKIEFNPNYQRIPKTEEIGHRLKAEKHEFFAEPEYQKELRDIAVAMRLDRYPDYIDKLVGFKLTVSVPYTAIRILLKPKSDYHNLHWYYCPIVFLLSRHRIRFFYLFAHYQHKNWNDLFLFTGDASWQIVECDYDHDSLSKFVQTVFEQFCTYVTDQIKSRFGVNE